MPRSRTMRRAPGYRPELGKEGVMAACLTLLTIHRIWHRRMNSGAIRLTNETTGKTRMFRANKKGTADILCTPQSLHIPTNTLWLEGSPVLLWIECKSSTGKRTPEQIEFEKEVTAAGHEYLVVNDVQQLIDWLKNRGVIR